MYLLLIAILNMKIEVVQMCNLSKETENVRFAHFSSSSSSLSNL